MFFQCTFCTKMFIVRSEADKHIQGHVLRLKKQQKQGKQQKEEARKREEERLKQLKEARDAYNKKLIEHKKKHEYLMRNCESCMELIRIYQQYNRYYNPWANAYYGSVSTYYSSSQYIPSGAGGAGVVDAEEKGDALKNIFL